MPVLSTDDLEIRLIYADACQADMAIKALEADANGDKDRYDYLINIVRGLHWRISALRCYPLQNGEIYNVSVPCLTTEQLHQMLSWIDQVCKSECCNCGESSFDDNPPALLYI